MCSVLFLDYLATFTIEWNVNIGVWGKKKEKDCIVKDPNKEINKYTTSLPCLSIGLQFLISLLHSHLDLDVFTNTMLCFKVKFLSYQVLRVHKRVKSNKN